MDSSIWFDTINLERSVVHIEGSHNTISKIIVCLSLKIIFVLANSVDPDEMLHSNALAFVIRRLIG